MTGTPPADREALQNEIEQTRADLGQTVEALAAKSDVGARTKQAAAGVTEKIEDSVRTASDHVAAVVTTAADGARTRAVAARNSAGQADLRALVRNPLTGAAFLVGIAVAVIVFVVVRRRS
jgi:hypothetical protein